MRAPRGPQNRPKSGGEIGAEWAFFGMLLPRPLIADLGPIWGPSWAPLGPILGPFGAPDGPSWALLRPYWGHLGPSWAPLRPFGVHLGPSWAHVCLTRALLGPRTSSFNAGRRNARSDESGGGPKAARCVGLRPEGQGLIPANCLPAELRWPRAFRRTSGGRFSLGS